MGRDFVAIKEAAQILKRSSRTVHTYIDRGFLRREYEDGKVVLRRADVEQLASEHGANLPALNNKTLVDLQARIRSLETQVAVFRKMTGFEERDPLRPAPELALGIIEAAKGALAETAYGSEEVHLWVDLFQRMDEATFEIFKTAGASPDCWQPVFNLCVRLIEYVADPKRCKDSRIWIQYHEDLTQCLRRLRSIILVWVESGKGEATAALRRHLGTGRDDLVRRLTSPNSN